MLAHGWGDRNGRPRGDPGGRGLLLGKHGNLEDAATARRKQSQRWRCQGPSFPGFSQSLEAGSREIVLPLPPLLSRSVPEQEGLTGAKAALRCDLIVAEFTLSHGAPAPMAGVS